MPIRLCLVPGCGGPVAYRGRCAEHSRRRARERYEPGNIYRTKRWLILRRRVLFDEPLCRHCAADGIDTLATQVDHVIPVAAGGDPWARANTQPLCASCHSRKTARELYTPGGEG